MKTIGLIGLGKMGLNLACNLRDHGWQVFAYNRSEGPRIEAQKNGIETVDNLPALVSKLLAPRLLWVMVSHEAVDAILNQLMPLLSKGDVIVEGGNSFFKDSIRRAKDIEAMGINFLDVGVSGGPGGARNGACSMIGGNEDIFKKYEDVFRDISVQGGYAYLGKHGAGHFVKMVHNGIEYGMMQAIGEGFEVLEKSDFNLNLIKVADLYNHKSVIESRLVCWLKEAYEKFGEELSDVSGSVNYTGEGEWTVKIAKELEVPTPIIEGAFKFRVQSKEKPSYTGKVVSALRNCFGGHEVRN